MEDQVLVVLASAALVLEDLVSVLDAPDLVEDLVSGSVSVLDALDLVGDLGLALESVGEGPGFGSPFLY